MQKTTLAVKVNYSILNRVKKFCGERGIKYGFFVEKALEERLEREELKEDLLDLKTLRGQEKEAVPLEEYLKKRRV
ncbi:unnamed protein product [marine sediment metagenome]|uniref:CopG family transcriptional regulator n=1 Tax=marine sediment metagenome TaxID=412755 RepID=X0UC36_9ZZZZ